MGETLQDSKTWVPELLDRKYVFEDDCKFAFVGDMHLNSSTPKSRIDDYPQTMINKLDILRNAMIARGVKYVICGGDIFHKAKQPSDFEYKVANEFLKFREAGIEVFSIFGN